MIIKNSSDFVDSTQRLRDRPQISPLILSEVKRID